MIIVTSREVSTRDVIHRLKSRFRARVLEWEHASMMLLWGVIVISNPSAFDSPSFAAFVGGPLLWGWAVFVTGVLRLGALGVNGYMARPTAMVRAIASLSGILLFAAISLGFLFSWRWGTALAIYPVIGFFGLFSLYWSVIDVALPETHDDAGS